MDAEAWWATVHGVAKSRTQLTQLSELQNCVLLSLPGDDTDRTLRNSGRKYIFVGNNDSVGAVVYHSRKFSSKGSLSVWKNKLL